MSNYHPPTPLPLPLEVLDQLPDGRFITLEDLTRDQAKRTIEACAAAIRRHRELFTAADRERATLAQSLRSAKERIEHLESLLRLARICADCAIVMAIRQGESFPAFSNLRVRIDEVLLSKAAAGWPTNPEGPQG